MDEGKLKDEINDFMNLLYEKDKSMVLIMPHLGKSREQLEVDIKDGMYDISTDTMMCWTGKQGLIETILATTDAFKNY